MLKKISLLLLLLVTGSSLLISQQLHADLKFTTKKVSDCEFDLLFNVTIDDGWHMYSLNEVKDGPLPTVFKFEKSSEYELVGKVKQSAPIKEFDKVFEVNVEYYEHKATFTQRIKLKTDKKIKITGTYEYQVCTDTKCDLSPPGETFEFTAQGTSSCLNSVLSTTLASNTPTLTETVVADSVAVKDSTAQAMQIESVAPVISEADTTPVEERSFWGIFIAGFIGGLAALLTPCVFPMIPMNVSFFTKQSKTKAQGIRNALLYSISIIVLYVGLGLGVTLIFGAGALHSLSTNVWFNLAFFFLLLVFAISFLGAFEITLPSGFVNKIDARSDKGGYLGIFFMAFTLALVSFSCTGPIIGTLLVQASSTGNITGPFFGMFGFALALALPFGLFAAFPGWLNSLPQSGGWLNAVKVTLGFLELALALKFASNADLVVQAGILTREVFIGLWIVIFALLTMYLLGMYKTSHDSDLKHVSVSRLFVAITSFFVTIYLIPGMWGAPLKLFSGILPPLEYSESPHGFSNSGNGAEGTVSMDAEFGKYMEVNKNGIVHFKNDYEHALAYSKKVGKPLLIDFTGHACANCRKTEDYVWPDSEVTKRLNNDVVLVSLYVDDKRELDPKEYMTVHWYGKERQITDIGDKFKYMEEKVYGQSTQPLYVLVDGNEKVLAPIRGYNPSIPEYITWLQKGIDNYKK
ncbi:MAG: thiol:disulfide interchange protein [Bacteroidota bacterium]|jgi:thiol:disulfide interchange protein DsbD|nr:thiol:disulfide interchange protein [Bacteroidota bacterium]